MQQIMDTTEENTLISPLVKTNGTFENPFQTWNGYIPRGAIWRYFKDRWANRERAKIPNEEVLNRTLPVEKPDRSVLENPPQDKLQYMWIGHASVLYQMGGWNILSDPIWSERCSPIFFIGPKRFRPPPLSIGELPRIDVVVISHNHYDHLDKDSVRQLNQKFGDSLRWLVPLGLASWFRSMSCNNVTELSWWESTKLEGKNRSPLEVVCTPAQHSSLRNGCDFNKSLWSSWVFLTNKHRVFFSGDTGYCEGFLSIGTKYGPFDLSAIAIGAYCPRFIMSSQHVDPQEALQMHRDLRSKLSFGIHWGTFPMGSTEPYLEPRELIDSLQNAMDEPKTFITVQHGTVNIVD